MSKHDTGRKLLLFGKEYVDLHFPTKELVDFDTIFCDKIEDIPEIIMVAIEISKRHGIDLYWCFERPTVKDHGEGGKYLGSLVGKVFNYSQLL